MSLQGKVAIVTGAAQGIGRAIAEALAEDGADIAVADLDPARSQEAVAAIQKLGRRALSVKVNVADWNDAKTMADQVMQEWGRIDILVNNAGITRDGLLLRMKEEDWNSGVAGQFERNLSLHESRPSANDQATLWTDCQYRLDRRRDG